MNIYAFAFDIVLSDDEVFEGVWVEEGDGDLDLDQIAQDILLYHNLDLALEVKLEEVNPCSGCRSNEPNQEAHCHYGGCLSEN